jgi:hypothetical protein
MFDGVLSDGALRGMVLSYGCAHFRECAVRTSEVGDGLSPRLNHRFLQRIRPCANGLGVGVGYVLGEEGKFNPKKML